MKTAKILATVLSVSMILQASQPLVFAQEKGDPIDPSAQPIRQERESANIPADSINQIRQGEKVIQHNILSTTFYTEKGGSFPVYIEGMPLIGTIVYTDKELTRPVPAGKYRFSDENTSGVILLGNKGDIVQLDILEDNSDAPDMDDNGMRYLFSQRGPDPVSQGTYVDIPGFGRIGGYYAIIGALMYVMGNEFMGDFAKNELPTLYKTINDNQPQSEIDHNAAYFTPMVDSWGKNNLAEYKTAYQLYLRWYRQYIVGGVTKGEIDHNANKLGNKAESCNMSFQDQMQVSELIRDYRRYMSYAQYDYAKSLLQRIDQLVSANCKVQANTVIFPQDVCFEKISGLKREVERLQKLGQQQEADKLVDYINELGETQCNPRQQLPLDIQETNERAAKESKERLKPEHLSAPSKEAPIKELPIEQGKIVRPTCETDNKLGQIAQKLLQTEEAKLSSLEQRLQVLVKQYQEGEPMYYLVEETQQMVSRQKRAVEQRLKSSIEYICGDENGEGEKEEPVREPEEDDYVLPNHCEVIENVRLSNDLINDGINRYMIGEAQLNTAQLIGILAYFYYQGNEDKLFSAFINPITPNIVNYLDPETGDLYPEGAANRSRDYPVEFTAAHQFYQDTIYASCYPSKEEPVADPKEEPVADPKEEPRR